MAGSVKPYSGHPYSGVYKSLNLEPGDILCRVWDRESGNAHGFDGTSWNPNLKPPADATAGRFDPLPPSTGTNGYLYGSQSGGGERVALLETFRSLMSRSPRDGRNVIRREERNRRSIRRFEVIDPVELINVNTQAGRECFRMDEEVLYVHDREATRTWAHAIKDAVTAGGIAYNSTRESIHVGCHSFILWQDRVSSQGFNVREDIRLDTPEGRKLVDEALGDYQIFWA